MWEGSQITCHGKVARNHVVFYMSRATPKNVRLPVIMNMFMLFVGLCLNSSKKIPDRTPAFFSPSLLFICEHQSGVILFLMIYNS